MNWVDLFRRFQKRFRHALNPAALDLWGDRDIEWAYIAGHIPEQPGIALDFGCGDFPMGLAASMLGYQVTAMDLTSVQWPFVHPGMNFIQADLMTYDFKDLAFDLILNCSTIEHVGLTGRYGSYEESNGDLKAITRLKSLLRPNGLILMTIPVGQDNVYPPYHRVYGSIRLPQLLQGFKVINEEYWIKRAGNNHWVISSRDEAANIEGNKDFYNLGLFSLKVDDENSAS